MAALSIDNPGVPRRAHGVGYQCLGVARDVVLERVADYLESQVTLANKISAILMYPVIMLLFAGGVVMALVTAIIQTNSIPDPLALVWLLVKVAGFFAITIALGVHVYPKVSRRLQAAQERE